MKIPRTTPSGNQLTNQAPTRRVNRDELATAGQVMAEIGKTASDVGTFFEKAQSVGQKTRAQNMLDTKIYEIQSQAEADPDTDPKKYQKYLEQIEKVKGEAAGLITLPAERDAFAMDADGKIGIAGIKIKSTYQKKVIDAHAADFVNFENNKKNEFISAASEPERDGALSEYYRTIDEHVSAGYMTREEGAKKKLAVNKWTEAQVEYDIARDQATTPDDSYTLNALNSKESGIYRNLPDEARAKLIETMNKKIYRNQKLLAWKQSQDQDKNEAQLLVKQLEGNLQESEIKDLALSQGIRTKFAEKMVKKLYDNPNPDTDFNIYNKVREMQLTEASVKEINQFILDNSEKLSNADKKFLINQTFSNVDKKQKTIIKYNSEALYNWAKNNLSLMGNESANVVYEFHRRVNQANAQGAEIDTIAQELQKEKIKESLTSVALMNDVPNFVADRNRLKKLYEKETKLKGKIINNTVKSNSVKSISDIDFDEL